MKLVVYSFLNAIIYFSTVVEDVEMSDSQLLECIEAMETEVHCEYTYIYVYYILSELLKSFYHMLFIIHQTYIII